MEQKIWFILIIIGSIGTYIYTKYKDKDQKEMDKILFILGSIFISVNSILVYLFYDIQILKNCIYLQDVKVAGKLIPIGYMFILISLIIFTEKLFSKKC